MKLNLPKFEIRPACTMLCGVLAVAMVYTASVSARQARAATVAKYLRDTQNVPMRRILVPAGYGAIHPDASNSDSQDRALNKLGFGSNAPTGQRSAMLLCSSECIALSR